MRKKEYKWMLMGSPTAMLQYPSPVLFVRKEGLYQCQVSSEDNVATSSLMHVVLRAADPMGTSSTLNFIVFMNINIHSYYRK